jgi:uncharacterized protein
MRLYAKKVSFISKSIVDILIELGHIEADNPDEVNLDIEAILNEYLRMESDLSDQANEKLKNLGLSREHFGRIKKGLAEANSFILGDEKIRYLSIQIVEMFWQSNNVDEIISEDYILRNKIDEILEKHLTLDIEIDQEVRKRIKNLEEGSSTWDIEYKKTLAKIQQRYSLE